MCWMIMGTREAIKRAAKSYCNGVECLSFICALVYRSQNNVLFSSDINKQMLEYQKRRQCQSLSKGIESEHFHNPFIE